MISPGLEARVARMMAGRTPAERLETASSMFDAVQEILRAALLHENPILNEAQIRARIFVRMYGDCFTNEEIRKTYDISRTCNGMEKAPGNTGRPAAAKCAREPIFLVEYADYTVEPWNPGGT